MLSGNCQINTKADSHSMLYLADRVTLQPDLNNILFSEIDFPPPIHASFKTNIGMSLLHVFLLHDEK